MHGPLRIRTLRITDSAYVVSLGGELDLAAVAEVEAELSGAERPSVIVDLLDVTFMDSAGLAVLVRASRRSRLTLVADRCALRVLERAGADDRFHIHATLWAAVDEALALA